jgi:glycine betaine transporter
LRIFRQQTFLFSLGTCILFLLLAFIFTDEVEQAITISAAFTLNGFGGYYLYFGCFLVTCLLVLAFSRYGKIRLGTRKPAYGVFSWLAMLFSTGMGAGLMLRAVQEPMYYFRHPPRYSDYSEEVLALEYTFFHWGLTPWAFYGMFGLIMAYMSHIHQRPMLSSSFLPSLLRKKKFIVPVDSITVICTLFGVVGAVGLGSRQVLRGMAEVGAPIPQTLFMNILVVLLIGGMATISAFSGLKKGIRNLSRLNIGIALMLLVFTALTSMDREMIALFGQALGAYFLDFVPMSLNLGDFQTEPGFLRDWTLFYWAFWMAWAPFTGLFIARISAGRTIRAYVLGVLMVPSLASFIWFTVFGAASFSLSASSGYQEGQFDSIYGGIFSFFSYFPFSGITKFTALLLIITFLITSIDSAVYVLGVFSSHGSLKPRKHNILIWGSILVAITASVLLLGQETLLNTITQLLVVVALPFSFLYAGMTLYFIVSLKRQDL